MNTEENPVMTNLSQAPVIEKKNASWFGQKNKIVRLDQKLEAHEISGGLHLSYLKSNDVSTIYDMEEDPIEITQFLLNFYLDGRCSH